MSKINYQKPKKIFKILDKSYIENLFHQKKEVYFPNTNKISKIDIQKTLPDWVKNDCAARYIVEFSDHKKIVIRGIARAADFKKRAYHFLQYLWTHGFDKGNLLVCRPLDFREETGLFLYQEAPGKILYQILVEGNFQKVAEVLKSIALWLIKLHSLPQTNKIGPASHTHPNDYFRIFQKIKQYYPELNKIFLPREKLSFINQIWQDNTCLIHNDFYPGNISAQGSKVWAIDFDNSGLGPYFADLAPLYGFLELEIISISYSQPKIQNLQKIFLETYCHTRDLEYQTVIKQLRLFLAKVFLDRVYDHASFIFEGWDNLDQKMKLTAAIFLRENFQKLKQYLD